MYSKCGLSGTQYKDEKKSKGSRKYTFSRCCKHFETYFLLTMHSLLLNYTNFEKTLGHFENLVFVIMSTRENIHLIARTS